MIGRLMSGTESNISSTAGYSLYINSHPLSIIVFSVDWFMFARRLVCCGCQGHYKQHQVYSFRDGTTDLTSTGTLPCYTISTKPGWYELRLSRVRGRGRTVSKTLANLVPALLHCCPALYHNTVILLPQGTKLTARLYFCFCFEYIWAIIASPIVFATQ